MSKYKIIVHEEWCSRGCDCCEPDYFHAYSIEVDGIPVYHRDNEIFYFPCIDDAQAFILHREGIEVQYTNQEYND